MYDFVFFCQLLCIYYENRTQGTHTIKKKLTGTKKLNKSVNFACRNACTMLYYCNTVRWIWWDWSLIL